MCLDGITRNYGKLSHAKEQRGEDGGNKQGAEQQRENRVDLGNVIPGGRLFFYILQEISDDVCFLQITVRFEPLSQHPLWSTYSHGT